MVALDRLGDRPVWIDERGVGEAPAHEDRPTYTNHGPDPVIEAPARLTGELTHAGDPRRGCARRGPSRGQRHRGYPDHDGQSGCQDRRTAANEGVFFLAATNHPWDLDPALRRPGRFDRLVFVPPPDAPARQQILALKIAGRPAAPNLDLTAAARATDGFSGADLQAIVERATEFAIEASLARGSEQPLDDAMLLRAIRDTRASTRPWFEVARNYAVYANEGGVYDELLTHLKGIGLA